MPMIAQVISGIESERDEAKDDALEWACSSANYAEKLYDAEVCIEELAVCLRTQYDNKSLIDIIDAWAETSINGKSVGTQTP